MVSAQRDADVVIVGAGAAGTQAAAILAEAGKKVLVLEAGPAWVGHDLVSSQIWAKRLKWGGAPVRSGGSRPSGHNLQNGWGMGGSALHHYANWPRLHAEDFKLASTYGKGRDWPISDEDLRPWYDRVQSEVGLSGDAAAEIWRPPGAPYPHPPFPTFPQAAALEPGFTARGWKTAPAPLAILTEQRGDRQPCVYDGWCDAGCPVGALGNPLVTYKPRADRAGAVFRARSAVTRIRLDGKGRAAALDVATPDGSQRIEASVIILAGGSVQSARLLLGSADKSAANGLSNSSGLVGVGFMAHVLVNLFGLFDRPLDNYLGVNGGNRVCRDGWAKNPSADAFGSHEWVLGPALRPNDLIGSAMTRPDLFGAKLARFMTEDAPRIANMGGLCETYYRPENRIELTNERDANGLPLAKTTHNLAPDSEALIAHVADEGSAIVAAAGAKAVWSAPGVAVHSLGGTVMGSDPATSVVGPHLRSWDVPNLMILGGGVFPSIGAAGPTFTIHALTGRAIDLLLKDWRNVAG